MGILHSDLKPKMVVLVLEFVGVSRKSTGISTTKQGIMLDAWTQEGVKRGQRQLERMR